MKELFYTNRPLFFEAVRSKVISEAKKCVHGKMDEFVLDVAVFRPHGAYLEEEAEGQLYAYLNSLYPGLVERQKVLPDGSRIDLAMLGYGVEVKLFHKFSKVEVDRAVGQSISYLNHFERVILVIYTTSRTVEERLAERLLKIPLSHPGLSVIIRKVE